MESQSHTFLQMFIAGLCTWVMIAAIAMIFIQLLPDMVVKKFNLPIKVFLVLLVLPMLPTLLLMDGLEKLIGWISKPRQ